MDTYSYKVGAALLAFAGVTTSTDISTNTSMPMSDCIYANISVVDTRSDRLYSIPTDINIPKKKNYRERYKKFAGSDMYKFAYSNRSLGDVIIIED